MKVAFITPYPFAKAPSQRFRFEQYFLFLEQNNIEFKQFCFLDDQTMEYLYKNNLFTKGLGMLKGFTRRFEHLFYIFSYDIVFIHREAAPIGPPIFEWMVAKVLRKPIIYDFDDAIWLPNVSDVNRQFSGLKAYGKIKSICRLSLKISAGNQYLKEYAQQFNADVTIIPTTIDTENHHNGIKDQNTEKVIIGWTGTHTTGKYLPNIVPIIKRLQSSFNIEFIIISNQDPELEKGTYTFIKWNKKTEIEDLLKFNIGIMPLEDSDWEKGKCGFKALQYMALGIPPVVSPVGVNTQIVKEGKNGYFAISEAEWIQKLTLLIESLDLRSEIGKNARQTIIDHYSTLSQKEKFLQLICSFTN